MGLWIVTSAKAAVIPLPNILTHVPINSFLFFFLKLFTVCPVKPSLMVCTSVQSPGVLTEISIAFQLAFLLTFLTTGLAMPPRSLTTREGKGVLAVPFLYLLQQPSKWLRCLSQRNLVYCDMENSLQEWDNHRSTLSKEGNKSRLNTETSVFPAVSNFLKCMQI